MKKQKSQLSSRLFEHWRTTLLGLIMLAFSGYAVLTGKATLSELKDMAGWLISAGLLLRSKDSLIGVKNDE